ncbi:DUF2807 domain-containing protein [Parasphingopyxis algicola]|uniref:head GIN domain-containing protein n=1 Tax=Parasphingopyxis algicola TaxID=2026624 RepID=UPI0015A2BFAE|nr:head GIN domain-containing protein [Parasphingopyxis algicola]QLC25779.1 DUF2807 domain-containing protein [Parasphingopyxis algicola]
MRMMVSVAALAMAAACTNSVAQESQAPPRDSVAEARNQAVPASRDYDLSGFDRVSLATPDTVEIVRSGTFAVRATGNSDILDELALSVEDGVLRIEYREDHDRRWTRRGGRPATIAVTMPSLNGVSLAGSGDIRIGRFTARDFEASIAGSGNIVIESLQTDRAEFEIAGSGDLSVAGTAGEVELEIAGSGDVAAGDFRTRRLDVDIAGSGDVLAYATETVEASFVGSGDVTVRGGARCRSSTIGSGRLHCS